MNTLEKLIQQYCPNGVEFKTLGECLDHTVGGGTPSKSKLSYWNGDIPWASVKDVVRFESILESTQDFITEEGLNHSPSNIVPKGEIIVATRISPGKMVLAGMNVAINQDLRGLFLKPELNKKFCIYYFKTLKITGKGTTVKGISVEELLQISVPVPPLPVQEEIVRILDAFTELEVELEAELEARRKQYEYYRNELLSFDKLGGGGRTGGVQFLRNLCNKYCPNGVEYKTLGEIGTLEYGKALKKDDRKDGSFPVLGSNGRIGTHNEYLVEGPCIIIGRKGSAGAIVWEDENCYPIDTTYYFKTTKNISKRFLYHFLLTKKLTGESQSGGVPGLNRNDVYSISVPIPPLPVQEEIVRILDRFDALVNDISVGLPAELSVRRQQYEYYRNRLLTFERAR